MPDVDEALRLRNERRLRALGIARARSRDQMPGEPLHVGEAGEPAVVEGVQGEWRVEPTLLDRPFRGRAALLSPFDRLVQDRKRLDQLFEFDYLLEMYKPVEQRRWGYYALPILHGDRLVGKLDATAEPAEGVLRVDAVHEDVDWPTETRGRGGGRDRGPRPLAPPRGHVRLIRRATRRSARRSPRAGGRGGPRAGRTRRAPG